MKKLIVLLVSIFFVFNLVGISLAIQANTIQKVQKNLRALGYYKGEPTGEMDGATSEAIKSFQKKCGLPADGRINRVTCQKLWQEVEKECAPSEAEVNELPSGE